MRYKIRFDFMDEFNRVTKTLETEMLRLQNPIQNEDYLQLEKQGVDLSARVREMHHNIANNSSLAVVYLFNSEDKIKLYSSLVENLWPSDKEEC